MKPAFSVRILEPLVRTQLSLLDQSYPVREWQEECIAHESRLPVVCSIVEGQCRLALLQRAQSRFPSKLLLGEDSSRSRTSDDQFTVEGTSSILMFWQELFRFGEYVCGRGSGTDEDTWPTSVSPDHGRLRSGRVSSVWLPWSAVFEFLHHDKHEAPSSLILTVCEEVSRDLEVLVRKPRMFLQRVRRMVPLGRAQQLDSACLSWLIKKPGRTAIEKAGSAQQILAVVREESFDTLENRVLKDFLRMAGRAGGEYLRDCADYHGSARVKTVDKFSRAVARYLQFEVFNGVRSVSSASNPNYVLQHDERYSKIWKAYQDLVRRQATLEHLHEWRARAYRDLVRLLFSTVIWSLSEQSVAPKKFDRGQGLWVRRTPDTGAVFESAGWPSPAEISGPGGCWLTMIAPEKLRRDSYMGIPIREIVAGFGADLVVVVTRPGQLQASIWLVWASFGCLSETDELGESESLARLSTMTEEVAKQHPNLRSIRGVLVTGSLTHSRQRDTSNVSLLSVTQNYLSWKNREFSETKDFIRKLIKADAW